MSVQYSDFPPFLLNRGEISPTKSLPPLPKDLMTATGLTNNNNARLYQSISTTTTISSNKSVIDSAISSSSSSSSCRTATNVTRNEYEDEEKEYIPMYDEQKNKSIITNNSSIYDLSYYFHSSNNNSTTTTNTYTNNSTSQEDAQDNYDNSTTITSTGSRRTSGSLYRARSLSIGSTISTHHYINSPSSTTATAFNEYHDISSYNNNNFNNHVADPLISCKAQAQIYKHKTDKSNKKAYQFFGEQIKLEISAKEIKREGLKALLFSTVPLGYFLYHLLNEYSSENLFFFLAVENYQSYNFVSSLERQQTANKIAKAYLTRNADLEVNLEDKIYRTVKKALLEQQRQPSLSTGNEFDAAKRHVFALLNVSYHRFRTSNIWDIMESKCNVGDMNNYNRERAQALVVNLLLAYIKRNNNNTSLYKLVYSFCKIYLPFGYEPRSLSPSKEEKVIIKEGPNHCDNSSSKSNRRNRSKSFGGGCDNNKKSGNFISSKFDTIFFKNSNKVSR